MKTIFKEEAEKYQDILKRITYCIDTLKFNSSDEKKMLIDLIEKRINKLLEADVYISYWDKVGSEEEPIERC